MVFVQDSVNHARGMSDDANFWKVQRCSRLSITSGCPDHEVAFYNTSICLNKQ